MKEEIELSFYDKSEFEQIQWIKSRKSWIKQSGNLLLQQMNLVVENEVMKNIADFYVHDIELLKGSDYKGNFLWIPRISGTFLISLDSEVFENGKWNPRNFVDSLLMQSRNTIAGFYLVENQMLKKISERSTFATLAIYEDIARNKVQDKDKWA